MIDDWKRAWRQAVENFQREVHEDTHGAPPRVRAMERELVSAAGALSRLDEEIRHTRRTVDAELHEEQVCRRREGLARNVSDEETARIAAEYAARHAERAAVLTRKLAVLEEERGLLARDLESMRGLIAQAGAAASDIEGAGGGTTIGTGPLDQPDEREFTRLDREARERAAAERLEELKRRMGG
jgi:hypothetical protein